jgi:hypothetical protein
MEDLIDSCVLLLDWVQESKDEFTPAFQEKAVDVLDSLLTTLEEIEKDEQDAD